MYRIPKMNETLLKVEIDTVGETIEQKCSRLIQNKEPIKDGVPIIFTDRKDGVMAGYNIRTDRWEVACDAMDRITKMKIAKRDEPGLEKEKEIKLDDKNKDTEKTA